MVNPNQGPKRSKPLITKEGFLEFIQTHKWDSVAYFLLFIGLIVLCFHELVGGLIVGVILGIYFSEELRSRYEQCKNSIEHEGIFRAFVVIAAICALLISTFGLTVGTFIGVVIRPIFGTALFSSSDEE